jgi:capsular exopolysaccharide synthesis family protein
MQHEIFETNHQDKGLSTVLAGTTTLEEAIQLTEVRGLELLTCGHEVPNPSEILNSESFAKLLELLSNRYDRVIIDSPPVMPVTDAQILAAICNITLLVLRAEKSTRKTSQQARDGLMSVGAHILGAVVNDVSKKSHYSYYSGYGYYGYYGYGRRKKKKAGDKKPVVVVEGVVFPKGRDKSTTQPRLIEDNI